MKPLIVLLTVFVATLLLIKGYRGNYQAAFSGRVAMAAMLLFTAIAHFAFTKGMAMMLPSFVPFRAGLIYLTGILEMAAAAGLLIPALTATAGWLLILFFVLISPANIMAAIKRVDYQSGNYGGSGPSYLWFRIPLQLLFITWVYIFAVKG